MSDRPRPDIPDLVFPKTWKAAGSEMPLLEGQYEAHHLTSHHRALPLLL